MILRDLYCSTCGHIIQDVSMRMDELTRRETCPSCHETTTLVILCNGGLNSRFRCNDWPSDPLWYSGQTDSRITAHTMEDDGSETPLAHKDGGAINSQIMGLDRRGERRDKIRYRMKKRAGKNKIYMGAN